MLLGPLIKVFRVQSSWPYPWFLQEVRDQSQDMDSIGRVPLVSTTGSVSISGRGSCRTCAVPSMLAFQKRKRKKEMRKKKKKLSLEFLVQL